MSGEQALNQVLIKDRRFQLNPHQPQSHRIGLFSVLRHKRKPLRSVDTPHEPIVTPLFARPQISQLLKMPDLKNIALLIIALQYCATPQNIELIALLSYLFRESNALLLPHLARACFFVFNIKRYILGKCKSAFTPKLK